MILFPNAKINLGLRILGRRADGYHDISTVMMPVPWEDILEIIPARGSECSLTVYGNTLDCPPEKNLVMKAWHAMSSATGGIPPVDIHLRKFIPDGAGMGGGSADAAFMLKGLNDLFNIGFDDSQLASIAAKIGADCPFFIYNRPLLCCGIGDRFESEVTLQLSGLTLLIAKGASVSISTAQAYAGAHISGYDVTSPADIASLRPEQWRGLLTNDFEQSVFAAEPRVAALKQKMYDAGAIYASMTGSGSAVFSLFESDKLAQRLVSDLSDCVCRTFKL